jgi:hypothetical protein
MLKCGEAACAQIIVFVIFARRTAALMELPREGAGANVEGASG